MDNSFSHCILCVLIFLFSQSYSATLDNITSEVQTSTASLPSGGVIQFQLGQESIDNAVTLKLYLMQASDWTSGNTKLTDAIYREANEYCRTNYGLCGLTKWQTEYEFTSSEVKYIEKNGDLTYPISTKNDFTVLVYLELRSGIPTNVKNETTFVLNSNALKAALGDGRNDIKAAVGFAVIGVGDDVYSPVPDYLLNIIMCIIGLVILLAVVLTAIGCWLYGKRQEREKKKRDSPNRVAPTEQPRHHRPKKSIEPVRATYFRVEKENLPPPPRATIIPDEDDTYMAPREEPQTEPQVEYVMEEPKKKHKKKKKSKKHKREDRQELTVIPMPDGMASYAYKVESDEEKNEEEEYDSGMQETSSQATQPNNNHYNNNTTRITTDL